jgi:hypothetical protein
MTQSVQRHKQTKAIQVCSHHCSVTITYTRDVMISEYLSSKISATDNFMYICKSYNLMNI